MATAAPLSTVIGVFPDMDQAEQAIDELRRARFSYERIRVVERGTGGFFDSLRGMFTGQGSVTSNTADNLIKMGLPEYEAKHYQNELDAHHVLVLMNADERPEDAFSIMRQNGAFDLNLRLRAAPAQEALVNSAPDEARNVRAQEVAQQQQNVPPAELAPSVPPSASTVGPTPNVAPSGPATEPGSVVAPERAGVEPVSNAPESTPRADAVS